MDFVKYIVSEFKSRRLSKADAASLLGQFASGKSVDGVGASACISPLLHKNTSTFEQIAYTSVLRGDEFFIASHRVNGRRLLPGVDNGRLPFPVPVELLDVGKDLFGRSVDLDVIGDLVHG